MPGLGTNFFNNNQSTVFLEDPYTSFLNPGNGDIDFSYLSQFKNKLIILNFSSEHWNRSELDVYDQLEKTDINFLMLTYDHTQHQKLPRLVYFPYWYVSCIDKFENPIEKNKIFDLGVLNGKPSVHRILNHIEMVKKSYIEKISIGAFTYPHDYHSIRKRPDDNIQLSTQEQELWNSIPKKGIINYESTFLNLDLPPLNESYFHLAMETTVLPGVFITEKIWKPLASKVPFLIYGNPGTMEFLKAQGIDTYDEVIDHKYYDTESDPRQRLKKLHQVLEDIMLTGTNKIYQQLVPRMTVNQSKFYNGEFFVDYLQEIKKTITRYS
jgi:hypothetical protein